MIEFKYQLNVEMIIGILIRLFSELFNNIIKVSTDDKLKDMFDSLESFDKNHYVNSGMYT